MASSDRRLDVVDVKGDGSCFFRAIYNAAREQDRLRDIAGCFSIHESTCQDVLDNANASRKEDSFVNCLRIALAQRIALLDVADSFYHNVRGLLQVDVDSGQLILASLSTSLRQVFRASPTVEAFRHNLAESITDNQHWVSEFEVEVIKHVMKKCLSDQQDVFRVVSVESEKELTEDMMRSVRGELVLVCINEMHYKYVRQQNGRNMQQGGRHTTRRIRTASPTSPTKPKAKAGKPTPKAKATPKAKVKPKAHGNA